MSEELAGRVAALEQLVQTLVERLDTIAPTATAATTSGADATPDPDRNPFWALDGLKAQVGETPGAVLYTGTVTLRLLLVRHILHGARTTGELAEIDGLGTTGQLYHHLRQLVGAGWLRSSARGQYAVPPERVVPPC